jgi:2-keto-4-pentenoate hydratase/2-oxohepta-3-ene-1,7-dioic acid hydratase in catechol pathway
MKVASYLKSGHPAYGVVAGEGVVTASERLAARYPTLRSLLAGQALEALGADTRGRAPDLEVADLTFLPVIPDPAKIWCIGVNYADHRAETGRTSEQNVSCFVRLTNSLIGHGDAMLRPKASPNFDFEGELAVIIGKGGRHIAEKDALGHIAGYSCFVDGSVRDYQKHSVAAGKNFHATGPFGPWMTTSDEIPDPTRLTLVTRLNGEEMQRSGTDKLIYTIPWLINYLSKITPLEPGDVIATGTPAGVGHRRSPQLWMKPGDVLEVEISQIGTLRNPVADEGA